MHTRRCAAQRQDLRDDSSLSDIRERHTTTSARVIQSDAQFLNTTLSLLSSYSLPLLFQNINHALLSRRSSSLYEAVLCETDAFSFTIFPLQFPFKCYVKLVWKKVTVLTLPD